MAGDEWNNYKNGAQEAFGFDFCQNIGKVLPDKMITNCPLVLGLPQGFFKLFCAFPISNEGPFKVTFIQLFGLFGCRNKQVI